MFLRRLLFDITFKKLKMIAFKFEISMSIPLSIICTEKGAQLNITGKLNLILYFLSENKEITTKIIFGLSFS